MAPALPTVVARVVVKNDGRKQVTVLGDRQRRHPELDRLVEKLVDAAGAVEQRKLSMEMKVNEVLHYSHSIVDGGFDEMS